jgi:signal transduction histidine kinase
MVSERQTVQCVGDRDKSCVWGALAFALGTLLTRSHGEADSRATEVGDDDQLLGIVVHELRTPVAIIKAYAELLQAQALQQQPRLAGSRELMSHIREQADLMADWVDAMLDLQRLQLGELRLKLSRVDLVQLAWTVAEEFQHTTQRHSIRVLATRCPPAPILADRSRLRQVLTNLLENAVKYSPGGTIQVRLGVQHGRGGVSRAMLAVHDEGPGLDVAELDRIFAPFEQARSSTVGLGLGLYLGRQIARLHGGDLWAESRGRMNGCTFVLALPTSAPVPTRSRG